MARRGDNNDRLPGPSFFSLAETATVTVFKRGKLHVAHIHCRQLFNMVLLTVTQMQISSRPPRPLPFSISSFAEGNTIRAEEIGKIRIIFYRLTILATGLRNAQRRWRFQRIMETR